MGTVGGATIYNQQSIGPIYKFESDEDLGLPLDYNVEAMEKYFNARPFEVIQRTGEILSELVPYFSRLFIWEYMIRQKIRDHEGRFNLKLFLHLSFLPAVSLNMKRVVPFLL